MLLFFLHVWLCFFYMNMYWNEWIDIKKIFPSLHQSPSSPSTWFHLCSSRTTSSCKHRFSWVFSTTWFKKTQCFQNGINILISCPTLTWLSPQPCLSLGSCYDSVARVSYNPGKPEQNIVIITSVFVFLPHQPSLLITDSSSQRDDGNTKSTSLPPPPLLKPVCVCVLPLHCAKLLCHCVSRPTRSLLTRRQEGFKGFRP